MIITVAKTTHSCVTSFRITELSYKYINDSPLILYSAVLPNTFWSSSGVLGVFSEFCLLKLKSSVKFDFDLIIEPEAAASVQLVWPLFHAQFMNK